VLLIYYPTHFILHRHRG